MAASLVPGVPGRGCRSGGGIDRECTPSRSDRARRARVLKSDMASVQDNGPATWSAAGREDAFAYWREVVCQAFTRLSPERTRGGAFAGEIRLTRLDGGASLSHIAASPQTVSRRRADVAAAPCDAVFVNIQLAGSSVVRQRGIETRLPAGSLALLDARQPFDMRFDAPFRQACLHVPLAWLEADGFEPATAIARRVDCVPSLGASFLRDFGDGDGESGSAESTTYLLNRLWLHFAAGAADTLADRHLALIRRYVADNCRDPDLSPGKVAAHFRISVRHLHKLFARAGISFGRFLVRSRLEQAHELLSIRRDRTIAEIAVEAGFAGASHFTRSFTRQYGEAPSALRRRSV